MICRAVTCGELHNRECGVVCSLDCWTTRTWP